MLALLLAVSTQAVTVTATADRDRVPVGDDVTYTLRAVGPAAGGFRVELPAVAGLTLVGRSERLDPVAGGAATQAYQLDLTLRATEVGTWRYAPVVIAGGGRTTTAPEVAIVVVGAATDPTRNPRLMELIRNVPGPVPGLSASLVTIVSSSRVHQGDQLDILTAAWFSRSLRARLRRPPNLKPPVLAGVWSVSQPAIPGIIATRSAGNDVFDLFLSHQVAFPLTGGRLVVPAARLEYAVPLTRRASGDERTEQTVSQPVAIEVVTLPAGPRPGTFRGPTSTGLEVSYRIRELPAHAGEPLPVDVLVSGTGNLAFWAPPIVAWPAGSRAYLEKTTETPRMLGGRLGGTKSFHFLVVSDSVGSAALPALQYEYFDPVRAEFRTADASGLVIPVLAGRNRLADREVPGLVAGGNPPGWLTAFRPRSPLWWTVALAPALIIGLGSMLRWRRRRPRVAKPAPPDGIASLERLVSRLVPDDDRGREDLLAQGLRRAGLTPDDAILAARLKLELDRLRFTPGDSTGVAALGRQAGEVVGRLPARIRRQAGVLAVLVGAVGLAAQSESPETLYREGAFGPAAAGFEARARATPGRWTDWYHAAAARYLAGEDAAAAAALTVALETAPRARAARALWSGLERQYEPLHQVAPRRGLSLPEIGLLSLGIAAAAWLVAGLGWRRRGLRIGGAAVAVMVLAAAALWPRPGPDRAFTTAAIRLHRSPHGLAPEIGGMPALTRVTVLQRRPDWSLIADRLGNRGWASRAALVEIDRLN